MERTSSIERLYFLGQFKNLKIIDTITDIPEEVALDPNLWYDLIDFQLTSVEATAWKYQQLLRETKEVEDEEKPKKMEEILFEKMKNFNTLLGEIKENV